MSHDQNCVFFHPYRTQPRHSTVCSTKTPLGNNRELITSTLDFQHLLTYLNLKHRSTKLFCALYPTLNHSFPQNFVFRCFQIVLLSHNRDDLAPILNKQQSNRPLFSFIREADRMVRVFELKQTKIFHIFFLITCVLNVYYSCSQIIQHVWFLDLVVRRVRALILSSVSSRPSSFPAWSKNFCSIIYSSYILLNKLELRVK